MEKKKYYLKSVPTGNSICSDGADPMDFRSKQSGIVLLVMLMAQQKISAENASVILEEILIKDHIPVIDELNYEEVLHPPFPDFWANIKEFKQLLVQKKVCEETGEPDFVACTTCGNHGRIIGPGFILPHDITSSSQGGQIADLLLKSHSIDSTGHTKLIKCFADAKLPEYVPNNLVEFIIGHMKH